LTVIEKGIDSTTEIAPESLIRRWRKLRRRRRNKSVGLMKFDVTKRRRCVDGGSHGGLGGVSELRDKVRFGNG
jgi:hypothetical protein